MTPEQKHDALLLVAKYLPPDNQRLNLALTTKKLWQTVGPTLIKDNVEIFLWKDPSIQPSTVLYSLQKDDPQLMERILESVDFEDGSKLQAQAELLSQQEGVGTWGVGTWGVVDDLVDYMLTLCFYYKSYRCLRVLITGLPAVRQALGEDPDRWRSYLDDDGEIRKYLSGFASEQ